MNGFMQIEGIKGQSIDEEHKDWIDILSMSHGLSQPINNAEGGSAGRRAVGMAQWDAITVSKQVDNASPSLSHYCASGENIKKVEVQIMAAGAAGKKALAFLKFTLEDVYISSYNVSFTAGGSERPSEDIGFSFGKIKWQFTPDTAGVAKAPVIKGWDRDKNKDVS